MIVERILEAVVIVAAIGAALRLVGLREREGSSLWAQVRERPFPVTAAVVTALLLAGAVVELLRPSAPTELARNTSPGDWWHLFTAPFLQGGLAPTVFNIVTAAVVLALAGWFWGQLVAAGVWLLAAWAPVGAVAGLVGYHVSADDVAAYSFGSSGATYFTAGTLCTALLLTGTGRGRLLGLVAPAVGVVMWLATNDGHGVLLVEGALLGLVLGLALGPVLGPFLGTAGRVRTVRDDGKDATR